MVIFHSYVSLPEGNPLETLVSWWNFFALGTFEGSFIMGRYVFFGHCTVQISLNAPNLSVFGVKLEIQIPLYMG